MVKSWGIVFGVGAAVLVNAGGCSSSEPALGTTSAALTGTLPSVQLCAHQISGSGAYMPDFVASPIQTDSNGYPWMTYSCVSNCDPATKDCSWPALTPNGQPVLDGRGQPKRRYSYVVDGLAGSLLYSTPTQPLSRTLAFHAGAGGTDFSGHGSTWSNFSLASRLERDRPGVRTVMIQWATGIPGCSPQAPFCAQDGGWFTRTSATPSTLKEQSKRVAGLLDFIVNQPSVALTKDTSYANFGTVGGSMGAVATFAARYWYGGAGVKPAYQLFIGGPMAFDVNHGCRRNSSLPQQGTCDSGALQVSSSWNTGAQGSPWNRGNQPPLCPTGEYAVGTLAVGPTNYARAMNYVHSLAGNSKCWNWTTDGSVVPDTTELGVLRTSSFGIGWSTNPNLSPGVLDFIVNVNSDYPSGYVTAPDSAPEDHRMGIGHMGAMHRNMPAGVSSNWYDRPAGDRNNSGHTISFDDSRFLDTNPPFDTHVIIENRFPGGL